ncbi:MAG: hypothetical protein K2N30_03935 [Clostridia bacterium]|nr:hypothetical protein [Clostridia bacterium]
MQEENNGVSLADIFKTIAKGKWVALIVALLITVAGVLFIQLSYNKGKAEYVSSFNLTLPGDKFTAVYTYPDGTTLHYADIISYGALEEVKNSDEKFAGIDVTAIVNEEAISISRSTDETGVATYTITAKAKFFKDYNTAREFFVRLANRPANYLSTINLTYDSYLSLAAGAEDYESQISYLKSQLNYVQYEFESLVLNYGGNFVVNGKTLTSYVNEIKAYKESDRLTILANQAREGNILKAESNKQLYEMRANELERQLKLAQDTLDKLTSVQGGQGNITYLDASVIKAQADLVGSLTQQLADAKAYSAGTVNPEFASEIVKEEEKITSFTDSLKTSVGEVYEKASAVTFINVNAVTAQGGMGLATCIVLSLVIGIIVAVIAAYIAGKYILGKKKTEKAPAGVFAEAEAQAAVTEDNNEEK